MHKTEVLRTCSLSSGSSGNAIFAGLGDVNILIDAGRSAKALCELLLKIDVQPNDLSAIFITHEHIDHVQALKVFVGKYEVPVYMVRESFNRLKDDYKAALESCINFIKPGDKINIGGLEVSGFETPHDSAASVGYTISASGVKAIGVATDIGHMRKNIVEAVRGCRILYIESNHDLDMLDEGNYPEDLKCRIRAKTGHLSNKECSDVLPHFIENGAKKIILYHLSGENNTPELALNEARCAIVRAKLNADAAHLRVAPKSEPCGMINMKITREEPKADITGAAHKIPAKHANILDILEIAPDI